MNHSPQLEASLSPSREAALRAWVESCLDSAIDVLEPASSDASFRHYFRLRHQGVSYIIMDAPPAHEDVKPFMHVAGLMQQAGLNVPVIHAADVEQGFLLLSDLGRHTYLEVLSESNADALYSLAIDALVDWQAASRPDQLPPYDEALLRRELALFPDWYLAKHLEITPDAAEAAQLEQVCSRLVEHALSQPRVYVHRDYMPRNLMVSKPMPGVLDFQDAVYGPVSYDPVCLFMDAFISWPAERVEGWLETYHHRALAAGVPVPGDAAEFLSCCRWMAVQRHLKVLGIFARIRHRDGKPRYLEDAPRFFAYLDWAIAGEPELAPLGELLARWRRPETAS
ncbi:aminoglycoside/choline kinase family phosphotransferase [Natronocella acetinitrilica]|uniref:Aminoglycoside/choline kinase family phosphotransferase n=1 Tax=Natronocella acetinitrilica TaxID=414046 RepID=A0AAE3G0C8_9GAMM|nr:phosphotransferase [Natronocella acetinitrilica]MCP1672977.1 aminoglycoside/choline kinase family phosphotransferase [Natronocella acetinitrilica]